LNQGEWWKLEKLLRRSCCRRTTGSAGRSPVVHNPRSHDHIPAPFTPSLRNSHCSFTGSATPLQRCHVLLMHCRCHAGSIMRDPSIMGELLPPAVEQFLDAEDPFRLVIRAHAAMEQYVKMAIQSRFPRSEAARRAQAPRLHSYAGAGDLSRSRSIRGQRTQQAIHEASGRLCTWG
jgi:hypothetical protein